MSKQDSFLGRLAKDFRGAFGLTPRERSSGGADSAIVIDQGAKRGFELTRDGTFRNNVDFAIGQAIKLGEELKNKVEEARDSFVTLFTQNMVQAAESGFKSILRSWVRTLQQMVARAAATRLFNFFANTGIGRAILGTPKFRTGGQFGVGGSGGPDSKLVAFRASPGEQVSVTRPGQRFAGGGNTFQFNNTFQAGVTRQELVALMPAMQEQQSAVTLDALRRAGRL